MNIWWKIVLVIVYATLLFSLRVWLAGQLWDWQLVPLLGPVPSFWQLFTVGWVLQLLTYRMDKKEILHDLDLN